ncbi:MAG: LacI family transcriptional regulator [Pseudonocardiales bacterium]|nr:LacI family transcriptional regulator [Pseudonocardiales bacterium]
MADNGTSPAAPGGARSRPTLEVVAARAGVSRATASRALRGDAHVSPGARDAVLRAADEISYAVNRAARSLVTRHSDSVAFLVAENENRMFSDPYFLGILRGAQTEVGSAGLQLVLVIAATRAEAEQFEHYAAGGHVDGVLLISLHADDALPRHLESIGVPTVYNGRPLSDDESIYSVDSDNLAGARMATDLLLARGARRIATISGPLDMGAGQDRLAGYRAALAAAGVPVQERHIVEGDFSVAGGARSMARLLSADPEIDAVFAASDLTAIGAMNTLAEYGRSIPKDVAVIGFDDIPDAVLARPALTTIRQPIGELGRTMARMLLARMAGVPVGRTTVLPVQVVQRESA